MTAVPPLSERDLLEQVISLAHHLRWRTAHFRPALTSRGWRTPVQGDGAGFPDLLLVRRSRILAVELKSPRGRATEAQLAWLAALGECGVETHVWQPADWGRIVEALR